MLISFITSILWHNVLFQNCEGPFWNPKGIDRKYPDSRFTLFQIRCKEQNKKVSNNNEEGRQGGRGGGRRKEEEGKEEGRKEDGCQLY